MKSASIRGLQLALLAGLFVAGTAHAEYRCNEPTRIHKDACKAAEQGATELRRFIERVRRIESLSFYDYVTDATWAEWDRKEAAASKTQVVASEAAPTTAPGR